MSEAIRVVVADDHPLFREGVVTSLQSNPDIEVVGQAADAAGALRVVREELPDLVLLDVTMPGGGISAAAQIASACPATRIVMLTVSEDEDDLLAAMKAGASGYVLKGVSARDLASVVRSVAAARCTLRRRWRLACCARCQRRDRTIRWPSSARANARCWSWSPTAGATRRLA